LVARRGFSVLLASLLVPLAGCGIANMNALMESWEGSEVKDLIAKWGPPSQLYSDGKGGAVLVYNYTTSYTTPAHSDTVTTAQVTASDRTGPQAWEMQSRTVYTPAQVYTYSKWRAFWVNPQGIIYSWQWRGL
jgi:hypothetical protein